MAIWQSEFLLVPRERIKEGLGSVPDRVSQDFVDTGTIASGRRVTDEDLQFLSERVPVRSSWDPHILSWGTEDGDRIDLVLEDDRVVEVTARIDARSISGEFIETVVSLASRWNCILIDESLRILPPMFEEVRLALKESSATRFVANPNRFLRE